MKKKAIDQIAIWERVIRALQKRLDGAATLGPTELARLSGELRRAFRALREEQQWQAKQKSETPRRSR
jgi:hypothetical protein